MVDNDLDTQVVVSTPLDTNVTLAQQPEDSVSGIHRPNPLESASVPGSASQVLLSSRPSYMQSRPTAESMPDWILPPVDIPDSRSLFHRRMS